MVNLIYYCIALTKKATDHNVYMGMTREPKNTQLAAFRTTMERLSGGVFKEHETGCCWDSEVNESMNEWVNE